MKSFFRNSREYQPEINDEMTVNHIYPPIIVTQIDPSFKVDYISKTIILGDAGVGKSSILKQFTENKFSLQTASTIGIDFAITFMKASFDTKNDGDTIRYLTPDNKGEEIKSPIFKYQIWDTGGQLRYHSIVKQYLRGATIVIYAFDITDRISFINLQLWVENVKNAIDEGKYMCVVVGNKLDIEKNRQVDIKEAQEYAKILGTQYFEVSAKKNKNINHLFHDITRILYTKMLNRQITLPHRKSESSGLIELNNTSSSFQNKCLPFKEGCVII